MAHTHNITVSFISAVYNKADYLLDTLQFLKNQTLCKTADVEFIFADDCSTDHSLALLQAEAEKDARIKVIANQKNCGPAVRFNQAARQARGDFLLPVDADDMLPFNAAAYLLACARHYQAPLVFGRSRRASDCLDVPADANVLVPPDPFAFCAMKKIVRMGFLVERALWARAGGANEAVFIQDQSLPLRLACHADRLAYVDACVYWLRPATSANLSSNIMQQHHDRFFSLLPFVHMKNQSDEAKKALMRQLVSSLWKVERDGGRAMPYLSRAFLRYGLNRLSGWRLSLETLERQGRLLRTLPDIRRPELP